MGVWSASMGLQSQRAAMGVFNAQPTGTCTKIGVGVQGRRYRKSTPKPCFSPFTHCPLAPVFTE